MFSVYCRAKQTLRGNQYNRNVWSLYSRKQISSMVQQNLTTPSDVGGFGASQKWIYDSKSNNNTFVLLLASWLRVALKRAALSSFVGNVPP